MAKMGDALDLDTLHTFSVMRRGGTKLPRKDITMEDHARIPSNFASDVGCDVMVGLCLSNVYRTLGLGNAP
jgi:hypothetical protein